MTRNAHANFYPIIFSSQHLITQEYRIAPRDKETLRYIRSSCWCSFVKWFTFKEFPCLSIVLQWTLSITSTPPFACSGGEAACIGGDGLEGGGVGDGAGGGVGDGEWRLRGDAESFSSAGVPI